MWKENPIVWKTYLECQCMSKEHVICLEYDEELGLMVFVQMFQWRGFFRRLLEAFRYLFQLNGAAGGRGSWDTCMIKPEDLPRVREWLKKVDDHGIGTDYVDLVEKKK
jgi:hypothetical protein